MTGWPTLPAREEFLLSIVPDPVVREAIRRTLVLAACVDLCPRLTSTFRTREEQEELWRDRSRNPYPVAPPGTSRHESGLAWDSVVPEGQWPAYNRLRESLGWKLIPSDPVHATWTPVVAYILGLGGGGS